MKVNFSEIKVLDLEGKDSKFAQPLHQQIAQIIFTNSKLLEMVDLSRDIHAGKEVELREEEVKEIRRLLEDEKLGMFSFVKRAIFTYLDKQALVGKDPKETK